MSPKGMRGRAIVVYLDPDVKERFQRKVEGEGRKMSCVSSSCVLTRASSRARVIGGPR